MSKLMEENLMDGGKKMEEKLIEDKNDGGKSDGRGKIDGWKMKLKEV